MIVYRRKGALVLLAVLISIALMFGIIELFGLYEKFGKNEAPKVVMKYIFFLPALINYLFSKIFLKDEREEIVTNERGEQYKLNNYSSLFFIRNIYWTPILLVIFIYAAYFTK